MFKDKVVNWLLGYDYKKVLEDLNKKVASKTDVSYSEISKNTIEKINFGRRIKTIRKRNLMTQHQLANLIGVSTFSIKEWEAGTVTPNEKNYIKLKNALREL